MEVSKDKSLPDSGEIIARIIKRSFWIFYDHLGFWICLNLVTVFLCASILGAPFAILALMQMVRLAIRLDLAHFNWKQYFSFLLHPSLKSVGIGLMTVLLIVIFSYSFLFYSRWPTDLGYLKAFLSTLTFWGIVFWVLLMPFLWSYAATEKEVGVLSVFKFSFFGVMAYPFVSIGILALMFFFTFVSYLSLLGFFLFWFSIVAIVWHNLFYIVFVDSKQEFKNVIEGLDDRSLKELFQLGG